jgi:endonuclease I
MKHIYFLFLLISTIGFAQVPSGYYDNAIGLEGYPLKSALKLIIDDASNGNGQPIHDTSVTYGDLWDLYETSDVRADGKVWEMYSDCDFTFITDQDMGSGGTNECDRFNREHSFPRSWFDGNQNIAIFADAFHVIPSDKKVNGIRGNLAFGEVATANYTSLNGSKRGSSSISGPTGDVFEPADEYKGDIARGFFYVATRYQNLIDGWETNDSDGDSMLDGSSDKVFEQWALDMLYSWHINDPVSQKEIDRNEAIFNHQDNRNPFIDNPQYVFDIWQDVLSIEDVNIQNSVSLYPNPIKDVLTVDLISYSDTKIEIYDILGKRVYQTEVKGDTTLNLQSLKSGVYIVKINQENSSVSKKLIKQ